MGFYNTGLELGFALSNIRDFIKNNIVNLKLEGNSFELFEKKAKEEILKSNDKLSIEAIKSIAEITRPYPKVYHLFDGIVSSIFILAMFIVSSYLVPFFIKWRDLKYNDRYASLMKERFKELKGKNISSEEKDIIQAKYKTFCLEAPNHDREHIKLYHKIFRSSILWYLLTVVVLFIILVFADYLYIKLR